MFDTKSQKILTTVGVIAAAVTGVIMIWKPNNSDENDDLDDAIDETYSPEKKSYNGYVPKGCDACGGPYPLCRDGCFDD